MSVNEFPADNDDTTIGESGHSLELAQLRKDLEDARRDLDYANDELELWRETPMGSCKECGAPIAYRKPGWGYCLLSSEHDAVGQLTGYPPVDPASRVDENTPDEGGYTVATSPLEEEIAGVYWHMREQLKEARRERDAAIAACAILEQKLRTLTAE